MARTFLSMARNVINDAGLSGNLKSVDAATGDAARIVRYVAKAALWIENNRGDWRFLWGGLGQGVVIEGQQAITAPTNLYRWDRPRLVFDGAPVTPVLFHEFRSSQYMLHTGYPCAFVIMPNNDINMYPWPDTEYAYAFSWYRQPRLLTNNDDEPLIPDQFRDVIESRALWMYAMYDGAEELTVKADAEYQDWYDQLVADQAPGGYKDNQSYGNDIQIVAE